MIKGPDPFTFGILLPVAAISLLNALRIEIFPRTLRPEEVTPEVITIPGGPGIPVPSRTPDLPETPGPPKPPEQPGEPEPAPGTPAVPEIPGDIVKEFKWEHKGQSYKVKLAIRHSIYDNFKSRERVLHGSEWAREYAAGGICAEIRELVHSLLLTGKPYGTYEEVEFVLSFVQHVINYESEEGEYPKYPVETLVEEAGDCEDFSILGASILKVMGYDAALLFLPGHAALGIAGATGIPGSYAEHQGRRYYYCEMTAAGWRIGQLPEGYEDVQIEVRPIPGIIIDTDLREE